MRFPRLDVLRAAAIFAVFWHHVIYHVLSERGLSDSAVRGNWRLPGGSGDIGDWCSFAIGQYGGWGVALFFVISGFCIHLSFLKWQASTSDRGFWRPYFIRRFFRIYPPYLFALGLACLPMLRAGTGPDANQFWTHVFMVHNLHADTLFGINPSFWSLAVEWQLYLVYPVFLLLCRRWGIVRFLLLVVMADVSLRALGMPDMSKEGWLLTQPPFFFWLTWGAGAWCAERAWSGQPVFPGERSVALALFVAAVLARVYQPLTWLSGPLVSVAFALTCDVYGRRQGVLSVTERIAVPLGIISYSFYLIHQPLIVQLFPRLEARFFNGNVWLTATIGGMLMFVVISVLSVIMYRWVEQRSNDVGQRLATRR